MNKQIKKQIMKTFEAPAPMNKIDFLQSLNYPKTTRFDFILSQLGYIRKRIWIISCLFIIAAFIGIHFFFNDYNFNFIGIISSVFPFLSLMTITEISRSTSHNMEELEMSCKYNFASVVLTRLGILGFFNMFVFGTFIVLFSGKINFGLFRIGLYLLIPFMLTCSLSLFTLNRLRSREAIYVCGVISCIIAVSNVLFTTQYARAFSDEYMIFLILALIILVVFTITETIKLIKKTEEMQWNLF